MTSDKVRSTARCNLDYALGKNRVKLSELKPEEFDKFLREVLQEVDLRELRGFIDLEQALRRTPGSHVHGRRQDPLETVRISEDVEIIVTDPIEGRFDLKTHVISAMCGVLSMQHTYREPETGRETTDWYEANTWRGAYVTEGKETRLFLRRPHDHKKGDDHLFRVQYVFEKVVGKDMMMIQEIEISQVTIGSFRQLFGDKSARIANDIIGDLRVATSRTLDALKHQYERYQTQAARFERIWEAATS